MTISRDEVERARLMSEYKYKVDTQSKIVTARRDGERKGRRLGKLEGIQEGKLEGIREGKLEGIREGKLEGIQEGKLEGERLGKWEEKMDMAKKLKADNVSIDLIAKYTGLPLEEISKLIRE